jgi:hypothetical protein
MEKKTVDSTQLTSLCTVFFRLFCRYQNTPNLLWSVLKKNGQPSRDKGCPQTTSKKELSALASSQKEETGAAGEQHKNRWWNWNGIFNHDTRVSASLEQNICSERINSTNIIR